METDLVLHQLTQQKGQKFLVVFSLGQVFPESLSRCQRCQYHRRQQTQISYPLQSPLDTQLLRVHEALHSDGYCEIDVIWTYVLSQSHLGASFRHTDHAFQMSNCDRV
jgi:hypothetical protein